MENKLYDSRIVSSFRVKGEADRISNSFSFSRVARFIFLLYINARERFECEFH